jgi:hypothetical protein
MDHEIYHSSPDLEPTLHPHVMSHPSNKFTVPFAPEVACCCKRSAQRCCHLRGPSRQSGAPSRRDPLSIDKRKKPKSRNCKPGSVGADASSSLFSRMAVHGSRNSAFFHDKFPPELGSNESSGSRSNSFYLPSAFLDTSRLNCKTFIGA